MVSGGGGLLLTNICPLKFVSLAPLRAASSPQKLADSEKCSQGAVKVAGAQ